MTRSDDVTSAHEMLTNTPLTPGENFILAKSTRAQQSHIKSENEVASIEMIKFFKLCTKQ